MLLLHRGEETQAATSYRGSLRIFSVSGWHSTVESQANRQTSQLTSPKGQGACSWLCPMRSKWFPPRTESVIAIFQQLRDLTPTDNAPE
jgi:hypothetical protein